MGGGMGGGEGGGNGIGGGGMGGGEGGGGGIGGGGMGGGMGGGEGGGEGDADAGGEQPLPVIRHQTSPLGLNGPLNAAIRRARVVKAELAKPAERGADVGFGGVCIEVCHQVGPSCTQVALTVRSD